ncbi:hypothetical protein [Phyllobacterium zundukense]|uniref:hypothetical protein n=1 Tax=Phyllobacterium zundukense TaxID=1867719 RepID=UPI0010552875|nr:hypothetical protein [Phyllobacterium zundukense]
MGNSETGSNPIRSIFGGDETFPNRPVDVVAYLNALNQKLIRPDNASMKPFSSVWMWYDGPDEAIKNVDTNIGIAVWQGADKNTWTLPYIQSRAQSKWVDAEGTAFYFVPRVTISSLAYDSVSKNSEQIYNAYQERLSLYQRFQTIPDGIQYSEWSHYAKIDPFRIDVDYINAGLSKTFPGMGYVTWHGADDIPHPGPQIIGLTPPRVYRSYADINLERLIPASQEMSAFWVRDRFPSFTTAKAVEELEKVSRHRKLVQNPWGPGGNLLINWDYIANGSLAEDWMGWDMTDMTKALGGPVIYPDATTSQAQSN